MRLGWHPMRIVAKVSSPSILLPGSGFTPWLTCTSMDLAPEAAISPVILRCAQNLTWIQESSARTQILSAAKNDRHTALSIEYNV